MVVPGGFYADIELPCQKSNREAFLVFHRVPLDTVLGYARTFERYITYLNDEIVLFAMLVINKQ